MVLYLLIKTSQINLTNSMLQSQYKVMLCSQTLFKHTELQCKYKVSKDNKHVRVNFVEMYIKEDWIKGNWMLSCKCKHLMSFPFICHVKQTGMSSRDFQESSWMDSIFIQKTFSTLSKSHRGLSLGLIGLTQFPQPKAGCNNTNWS